MASWTTTYPVIKAKRSARWGIKCFGVLLMWLKGEGVLVVDPTREAPTPSAGTLLVEGLVFSEENFFYSTADAYRPII